MPSPVKEVGPGGKDLPIEDVAGAQVLWGPVYPEEAHQQGGGQQLPHEEDEAKYQVAFVPQVIYQVRLIRHIVPVVIEGVQPALGAKASAVRL